MRFRVFVGLAALAVACTVAACGSGLGEMRSKRLGNSPGTLRPTSHQTQRLLACRSRHLFRLMFKRCSGPSTNSLSLNVAAPSNTTARIGRHWEDHDRDCQDVRAEVLIEESRSSVSFATEKRCRVTGGEWLGPWSGEVFTDASDVDIDHHVPLGHAHVSGGWLWDADRKREYANDLSNPPSLQVTGASVNRSKGKKPPDAWRPEIRAGWCRYAADWIDVKSRWQLTVTHAETRALRDMLDSCDYAGSWGLSGSPSP